MRSYSRPLTAPLQTQPRRKVMNWMHPTLTSLSGPLLAASLLPGATAAGVSLDQRETTPPAQRPEPMHEPTRESIHASRSMSVPIKSASSIRHRQALVEAERAPVREGIAPAKPTTPSAAPAAMPPTRTLNRSSSTARIDKVNPFIGSGGIGWGVGSIVPGPTLPFGMVKLSPDTTRGDFAPDFAHCGGYWYPDTEIRGFSHNHLVGTGASDQGNILIMPLIGIDNRQTEEAGYRSTFSHDTEVASPGYYAVTLDNGGIRAELTATERVGLHRYTFPSTNMSTLLFDLTASIPDGYVQDVQFEILPEQQEIVGSLTNMGGLSDRYGGQRIYFSAYLPTPFSWYGTFADGQVYPDRTTDQGERVGAWIQYTTTTGQAIEVQVGISYVSVDQARLNRLAEADGVSFDEARSNAEDAWEDALSVVDVVGGTETQQRIFYSALYHSKMMPTLYTDVNGQYRGFDGQSHQATGFTYYTDFSMWDTFRTFHPLTTLLDPVRAGDFNTSLLKMFEQSGFIDRWPQGNGPTGCMVGDSAAIVIADAYLKGVRNFDQNLAWKALWQAASLTQTGKHRDYLDKYESLGYIPIESGGRSASHTLEDAYDDGALSSFASALGHTSEANTLRTRSLNYRNLWDTSSEYLVGRHEDGSFASPIVPRYNAEYYAEGSAVQWSWYAPHDVAGLISLFGGASPFERRLDSFFARSQQVRDTLFPDMNYWHGNEPDIHAPWLYHWLGRPDKSADMVRWVMESKYHDAPEGLDGNDDGGTLSAWYVLSSIGLFPIAGNDFYLIAPPLFDQVTLHLSGGDFTIQVTNPGSGNLYIQSAILNGKSWNQSWFRHSEIKGGGSLVLTLGPSPSSWGRSMPYPPSISDPL